MLWLLLIPALYLLILLLISWFSLHPVRSPFFISPGAMDIEQEEVEFPSEDGTTLRGWWIGRPQTRATVVLAHGYLMNRSELTPLAVQLWREGCSALVFDFRAHGKSGGRKCGLGWIERKDAAAAARYARSRTPEAKIVMIGSSMGASASALAMADNAGLADALILDSGYSRLSSAVLGWWRFLGGNVLSVLLAPSVLVAAPMAGFNPFKVDIAAALRKVSAPVLILHGDCDSLALPREARRNADGCDRSHIVWLASCGHSEGRYVHPELYYRSIEDFLRANGIL